MKKDAVKKDAVKKDAVKKDGKKHGQKKVAKKDGAEKEPVKKDAVKKEGVEKRVRQERRSRRSRRSARSPQGTGRDHKRPKGMDGVRAFRFLFSARPRAVASSLRWGPRAGTAGAALPGIPALRKAKPGFVIFPPWVTFCKVYNSGEPARAGTRGERGRDLDPFSRLFEAFWRDFLPQRRRKSRFSRSIGSGFAQRPGITSGRLRPIPPLCI